MRKRSLIRLTVWMVISIGSIWGAKQDWAADEGRFVPLFPENGVPAGWVVREWNDWSKPSASGSVWTVENGILKSGPKRDNWLVSEKEYGDFILEFEIKLTELGNSGVGLRAPMKGDPAFEAMEMQIADFRYNTDARPFELTGAIYRAAAPLKQVYRPTDWNSFSIELKGQRLRAILNGVLIQDLDLSRLDQPTKRHDGSDAIPVKDRPLRGHIGFQHLTRDSAPVLIRNARIKELRAAP